MKRILFYILFVVTALTATAQTEQTKATDDHKPFQATVLCDGRPVTMTFTCNKKRKKLAIVGYSEYGKPAIDTATVGRIVLPDSVTDGEGNRRQVWSIGRQAFAHCSHITEVVMPDGLCEIGDQAFYGCSALRELTLPQSLTVIYPFAFRGCHNLSIVRVRCGKRPAVYDNIFDQQTLDHATLFVPAGASDNYANSLVFGMFRYRFEELE